MLTNITKIQEFQRKLYEKARSDKKYRFYSLYDKTYRGDVLEEAYQRAKSNGGAPGVDGETFEDIENRGRTEYLAVLQKELKEEQYKPKPVKRVYIPKANGKMRPLGIPTARDRIVQTAFLMVIEPIFEADFSEASYGFRPKKSAHGAIREIYKYLNLGCEEVYDVDLEKYFDTVEHWKLMKLLASRISDGKVLHVIKQWLSCGYVENDQHHNSKRGTPQGGVISPLLANIYLNPMDKAFERMRLSDKTAGDIHLIRYADDLVVLAKSNLEKGVSLVEHYVERLGLSLNTDKTRRINFRQERHLEFLGFEFLRVKSWKTGKRFILVRPGHKSLNRCREKIRGLINKKIPLTVQEQVNNLNRFITGWTNYFRLGHSSRTLSGINMFINCRLRKLTQTRKGNKGFGWKKVDSDYVYGKLGLFYNYKVLPL